MQVAGSALSVQRVAVQSPLIKEYASLVSTAAFSQMAGLYIDAVAPAGDVPPDNLAGLANPPMGPSLLAQMGITVSLFPQAHAGFGDFLWGAINFILPIESFGIVFEQLGYLTGVKEGEFDAVAFGVALVDVLTIFPPAAPLKAVVKPFQAMLKISKRVNPKFARYFGVAISRALRKAKTGDFDTLWNLLPFMVLAAELYADPEAREGLEFMMSTVNSGDDLLSWVDYLALPADGWEGDEVPQVDAFSSGDETTQLPLSFLFEQAHAQSVIRRVRPAVLGRALRQAAKRIDKENAGNLADGIGEFVKALKRGDAKELRKYVFKPSILGTLTGLASKGGMRNLRAFLKGKTNARYNILHIAATVAYLEWEGGCGKALDRINGDYNDEVAEDSPNREAFIANAESTLEALECEGKGLTGRKNRRAVYQMYTEVFRDALTQELDEEDPLKEDSEYDLTPRGHGSLFHLVQVANYQLQYRAGGTPIKAIEGTRHIWVYEDADSLSDNKLETNASDVADELQGKYIRRVDIALGEPDGPEQWLELKSYAGVDKGNGQRSQFLKVLNTNDKEKNTIERWSLRTAKAKASDEAKNVSLHRQFSLDSMATYVQHARDQKNEDDEFPVVNVAGFTWYFQKFNAKWKKNNQQEQRLNVDLGSVSEPKSIKAALTQPLEGTGSIEQAIKANYGSGPSASRINTASFSDVLNNLAAIGFDEVLEQAVEEE